MRYSVLVLAFLAAGCAPSSGDASTPEATQGPEVELALVTPVGLSTDRSVYAPGDSLAVRLLLETDAGYNLCHTQTERLEGNSWMPYTGEIRFVSDADREADVAWICDDLLYLGSAGDTARYTLRLSDRLEAGTYRLWTTVGTEGALVTEDTLATDAFEVGAL